MAKQLLPPTLADAVVTALSPVLIMGLVGSLVFFLAEVFYAGRYEDRLLYTLCFFVAGSVLVGRIAVAVDRKRAWAYGGVLALVTFIALQAWIEFPDDHPMGPYRDLINVVLILVVWWASNRLVRDCTYIDDKRTGSGKGLLAAAGWEKRPGVRPDVVEDIQEDERKYAAGSAGWYQRFDQWKKSRDKKPHTPGLTVVYFSIAALPIFGLGQALIPSEEDARRAFSFRLAAIYVMSGLALLMTTSFLGLRRYLRQRKLQMPATMTATWMGLGAVLILAFVLVGAMLPRPYSESPVWNPRKAMTQERDASRYAVNRDSGGKGEGQSGEQATKGDGKATGKGGEPGAKGKSGEAKTGSGNKDGKNGGGEEGKKGDGEGKKGDNDQGDKSKDGSDSGREASAKQKEGQDGKGKAGERSQTSSVGNALSKIGSVLKWIIFALVALVVMFVIFRHGLQFLANFMPWAKNLLASIDAWWKGLFGSKARTEKERESIEPTPVELRVPFAAFSNPFVDGTAQGRSPEDLVRYSFDGLEAWANDRDLGRAPDETPIEFATRLGESHLWFQDDTRKLAILVARMAYAGGNLPSNSRKVLGEFWGRITAGADEAVEVVG
ncbi:MAG: hypothetical protein EXS09_18565 [Gemmataceae bacterium]|nr:hypothetical protein [Gemmataceae bacterium]